MRYLFGHIIALFVAALVIVGPACDLIATPPSDGGRGTCPGAGPPPTCSEGCLANCYGNSPVAMLGPWHWECDPQAGSHHCSVMGAGGSTVVSQCTLGGSGEPCACDQAPTTNPCQSSDCCFGVCLGAMASTMGTCQ